MLDKVKRHNINDPDFKEKYKSELFTDKGYDTLTNYMKNLILIYVRDIEFPYKMNAVLGIPLFEYALEMRSHEELLGRIKLLGQILGVKELSFTTDEFEVKFQLTGRYEIAPKK